MALNPDYSYNITPHLSLVNFLAMEEEDKDVSKLLLGLMEGYSDSVIPSLSDLQPETTIQQKTQTRNEYLSSEASTSKKKPKPSPRIEASQCSTMEKQNERERRAKMSDLYSVLQSKVPNLQNTKAVRTKIVDETIFYIKELEGKLKSLEARKEMVTKPPISMYTHQYSTVDVTVSDNVAFFGIRSVVRRSLVPSVFHVFDNHKAEVLAANIAVNDSKITLTVTAIVNGGGRGGEIESIKSIKRDLIWLLCVS